MSELGVGPTDAVAIMLPLIPQNYISLIAGTVAGIAAPVNWMLEPSQLTEIINATRAKVLICLGPSPDFEIWDKVTAMRARSHLGGACASGAGAGRGPHRKRAG